MSDLKDQLIKLGSENPELQEHLKPILDKMAAGGGNTVKELINQFLHDIIKDIIRDADRSSTYGIAVEKDWSTRTSTGVDISVRSNQMTEQEKELSLMFDWNKKMFEFASDKKVLGIWGYETSKDDISKGVISAIKEKT